MATKKINIKRKKKGKARELIALILALIAIAFLLINSIYFLVMRETIITEVMQDESIQEMGLENLPALMNSLIIGFVISWLILMAAMSVTVYFIEKKKWPWYFLLILSILSLFTARIDTAVCGIVASILYIKR